MLILKTKQFFNPQMTFAMMLRLSPPPPHFLVFFFVSVFLAFAGCKRMPIDNIEGSFKPDEAKEWYYGVFKKSSEYLVGVSKVNKLPDWNNPSYRRTGNLEIIEFPLLSEKKSFGLLDKRISESEREDVVRGSLSRVAFIKSFNRIIDVREVNYVPEYNFLRSKGYDISDVTLGKSNLRFSGHIMVKTWAGDIVSTVKYTDGRYNGKLNFYGNRIDAQYKMTGGGGEPCEEICWFEQTCFYIKMGDTWIPTGTCTEWTNTGECWTVDCEDENYPNDCELYGVDCGSSGGSGHNPQNPDGECNMSVQDANNILNNTSGYEGSIISYSLGAQTTVEQKIIQPVNANWQFYSLSILPGFKPEWSARFTGKRYKNNLDEEDWKWEALSYSSFYQSGGILPPCTEAAVSVSSSVVINSSDKRYANAVLSYSVVLSIKCQLNTQFGPPKTGNNLPALFVANNP